MAFEISEKVRQELYKKGEFFITQISFASIGTLISWIMENRPAKKDFTLLINSSGGTGYAIIYLASFLGTLPKEVRLRGVAFGECGSAALALLQCCHERIAVDYCGFFIHHANTSFEISCQTSDLEVVKNDLAQSRVMEEEVVRLQCRRAGLSRAAWMKLADAGTKMPRRAIPTREALKLGLIDRVVERYPIF